MESTWRNYKRTGRAQMRPVNNEDFGCFYAYGLIEVMVGDKTSVVTISEQDLDNGSPKVGDMIARNPKNQLDQWLVSKDYFEQNFERVY